MLEVAVLFSSRAAPWQVELLTGSHIVVDLLPVEVEIVCFGICFHNSSICGRPRSVQCVSNRIGHHTGTYPLLMFLGSFCMA